MFDAYTTYNELEITATPSHNKLSFIQHYTSIMNKAKRVLSFVLRTAKPFKHIKTLILYCFAVFLNVVPCFGVPYAKNIESI